MKSKVQITNSPSPLSPPTRGGESCPEPLSLTQDKLHRMDGRITYGFLPLACPEPVEGMGED